VDRLPTGLAQGFPIRSRATGSVSSISVYTGQQNRATKLNVALYSDHSCRPGVRLTAGSRLLPKAGRWNRVSVHPASVRSGASYWLVVLGTGGTLDIRRSITKGCGTEFARQASLRPQRLLWRMSGAPRACPISAYAAGALNRLGVLSGGGPGSGSGPGAGAGGAGGPGGSGGAGGSGGSGPTLRAQGFIPANFYVSQNPAGAGDGSSCANAAPATWFNNSADWGPGTNQIGPGKIVGLCGTIASQLSFKGSGASGNPITVFWEPGSTMSSPDWSGRSAITTNGNSYITLNGGNNSVSIQATAEGTGLAGQGVASQGIYGLGCNGCTFANLTIANLYVHTATSDNTMDQTLDNGILYSGSNVTVADNTIHDVGWAVFAEWHNGDQNNVIYGNEIYRIDHGLSLTGNGGTVGPMFVFDNHIHDMANWDCGGGCHHDDIHCFGPQTGTVFSGFYIYDNRFDGTDGNATSSATFIEGNFGNAGDTPCAASGSSVWIFNNVSAPSDNMPCCGLLGDSAGGAGGEFNNMTLGPSKTQNVGTCMGYGASINGSTDFFENNIMDNCDFLIGGAATTSGSSTGTYAAGTPDYDAYVSGGANAFSTTGPNGANCHFMPFTAFASWKTCMGGVEAHGQSFANNTSAGINGDGSLTSGSPLMRAGNNLTGTCNSFPMTPANVQAACQTTYSGPPAGGDAGSATAGAARPTNGAWSIGAY
jgi:hypothetical protein